MGAEARTPQKSGSAHAAAEKGPKVLHTAGIIGAYLFFDGRARNILGIFIQ